MNTLSPRSPLALAAMSVLLVTGVTSQQPYGRGTPGSGGFTPWLSAAQPRVGDAGFRFDLQCTVGGAPSYLFLATQPGALSLLGVDLLVNPATILVSWGGNASAGGAGAGRIVFPLPVPPLQSLVGVPLHAQALVLDPAGPQGLSASRGLRFGVAGAPSIFVACSILNNDPYQLVDPIAGTVVDRGSPAEVDNTSGAAFDLGGNRLFTSSSIRGTLGLGDLSTLPIRWSTLWSSPASSTYGVEIDRARQRVWTLSAITGGSRELVAIDVDASSATYGTVVHNTVGMVAGNAERWDLAPSGNLAAVLTYLPDSITIVDTDRGSATFLQNRFTQLPIPVDQAGPLTLATQVAITPDERWALVTLQGVGATPAEIARLDLWTGTWFDHDPSGPATNISPLGTPGIVLGSAPTSIAIASHGRFAIVGGFGGCGWVGRLDLDPKNPHALAWTPFAPGVPLANGWTAALSNDEREVCVPTWPRSGCSLTAPQLVRIDVGSGALLGTIAIPANSNGPNQNLYTAVYR